MARWFYVTKENSGKGWRLIEESVFDGKRTCKTVPKMSFEALGVNFSWTIEQARKHIKALNKKEKPERDLQRKIVGASNRALAISQLESVYLPKDLVEGFTQRLLENKFGSESHNKRILSHWKTVCKIIRDLRLDPQDFSKKQDEIYGYFISKHHSSDYSKKLIRVFNLWGDFVSEFRNQPYRGIKNPRGNKKSKIDDSYIESDKFRGESLPLTPEHLNKGGWDPLHLNWLSVSVWFGLRPVEIDNLKKASMLRVSVLTGVQVLWVYQSKLTSIDREKRWKAIPCIFPEQLQLLDIIKTLDFERPRVKHIAEVIGRGITLYGGRKGFVDLMLDRGQSLENISMWLGHQSIEMTWKKYRNKLRVSWKVS